MKVNVVGILACPGGFEPPTCRLEGGRKYNNINVHSNEQVSCSLFRPANESITYKSVGMLSSPNEVMA